MSTPTSNQTDRTPAVACTGLLGHCIVCGSELLLELWRGHPDNRKIHCNHCGSEIAPWLHQQRQKPAEVPSELKKEIARILKDAFDCGFNATDEHAFWFFDGVALADKALEHHWPNSVISPKAKNDNPQSL